jgi:hypothetical protein
MTPLVNQYAILYQEYMMTAAMVFDFIGLWFLAQTCYNEWLMVYSAFLNLILDRQ